MSSKTIQNAAKLVADVMDAHYVGPIDSPTEFFPDEETIAGVSGQDLEDAVGYLRSIKTDDFSDNTLEFRQQVLEEVKKNLKL